MQVTPDAEEFMGKEEFEEEYNLRFYGPGIYDRKAEEDGDVSNTILVVKVGKDEYQVFVWMCPLSETILAYKDIPLQKIKEIKR